MRKIQLTGSLPWRDRLWNIVIGAGHCLDLAVFLGSLTFVSSYFGASINHAYVESFETN